MKRSSRAGFTLVEILVVIAIIAVLAAVLTVNVSNVINSAKRVKAANIATQIQTGIMNYYTEYGLYPVPPATTTDKYYNDADTTQQGLMYALCGNINASTGVQGLSSTTDVPNTRQIAYLTPKRSDVDTKGVLVSPFLATSYFYIIMDADYSGIAGDSGTGKGLMPDFTNWKTGNIMGANTLANGVTQGATVWADCDPVSLPPKEAASKSPQFWVHTY